MKSARQSPRQSPWLLCAATDVVVGMAGCDKQPPGQTQTAMAPPGARQRTPPSADVNRQVKDRPSDLGASQGDMSWVMGLPSAHFKAGGTAFEPSDAARIEQVATLLPPRINRAGIRP